MKNFFKEILIKEILDNLNNNFTTFKDQNFFTSDYEPKKNFKLTNLKDRLINKLTKKYYSSKSSIEFTLTNLLKINLNYFEYCYNNLEDQKSKNILIQLVAIRVCGAHKIKLSIETDDYKKYHEDIKLLENREKTIKINFRNFLLTHFELEKVKVYNTVMGMVTIFKQEQYSNYENQVFVEENNIVLDCGGCWGETALYFAEKAKNGKVFSFEFIKSNIDIFEKNISINKIDNIEIIPNPLWSKDNLEFFYYDNGPASQVSLENTDNLNESVKSTTIDKIVSLKKLSKVDFIKMDIEGAELEALKGAENTIRNYKPKLAISLYHRNLDFYTIPKFIKDLKLGYKFYLGHATPSQSETVLFAKI